MKTEKQKIVGRVEEVDLPTWDFFGLDAKIDTGAFTSSLHCHHIEPFTKNGEKWVSFYLLDPDHKAYNEQKIEMPIHDRREVKSSNGETEYRYFVQTKIRFYNNLYDIEFSLTNRSGMKYPLLIGRKFLRKGPFITDVTKKYITNEIKTKES
ncbi:ATP-dependent zinc protease [Gracilimonas sp.]|uniref:ATP-dependent zinc protease family protein n=1 Tax=Gracilimonas sp. TaxID=1974203 RepID=UPI002871B528|nr:RimK/LysX family protein [Gracilimonas sp.]